MIAYFSTPVCKNRTAHQKAAAYRAHSFISAKTTQYTAFPWQIGNNDKLIIITSWSFQKPRQDLVTGTPASITDSLAKKLQNFPYQSHLYGDLPDATEPTSPTALGNYSTASKLGLRVPNLAPDIDTMPEVVPINPAPPISVSVEDTGKEPKKKKYAKEAWPGKKPTISSLLV